MNHPMPDLFVPTAEAAAENFENITRGGTVALQAEVAEAGTDQVRALLDSQGNKQQNLARWKWLWDHGVDCERACPLMAQASNLHRRTTASHEAMRQKENNETEQQL